MLTVKKTMRSVAEVAMRDDLFDLLTRTLTRGVSRRAGIGILAGAGLAMVAPGRKGAPGVSAQQVNLNQTGWGFSPGEPCVNDEQCDNSFPELGIASCAENGSDSPYGPDTVCCRYEGGVCGGPLSARHDLCCGALLCIGGVCGWP